MSQPSQSLQRTTRLQHGMIHLYMLAMITQYSSYLYSTEVIPSEILTDDLTVETQASDADSSYRDVSPPNAHGITPLSHQIDTAVQQALEKFGLHQHVPQGPHYPYSPYPHAPPYHHYPSALPYQMPAPYVINNANPFSPCYPSVPQIVPPFVAPFPQQTFPSQNPPPMFVFQSAF